MGELVPLLWMILELVVLLECNGFSNDCCPGPGITVVDLCSDGTRPGSTFSGPITAGVGRNDNGGEFVVAMIGAFNCRVLQFKDVWNAWYVR